MSARRSSARVLAVNARGQVLVLVIRRPDGSLGLMSPGGRLEPGEGELQAAVRELHEETGIVVGEGALVGAMHRTTLGAREHVFFAVSVDDPPVDFTGHQPDEQEYVLGHEWLTPDDLRDDPRLINPRLPDVAHAAVRSVLAAESPLLRATGRVLPVSPDGAVLLLEEQDPAAPGERYWASAGGAVDPGETRRETATRELFEETGVVADPRDLVGPVHRQVAPYSWDGVDRVGDSTYFALPLSRDVTVRFDGLEPEEIGNVLGAAWWAPEEIEEQEVPVRPPGLPDIMRAAVAAVSRTKEEQ